VYNDEDYVDHDERKAHEDEQLDMVVDEPIRFMGGEPDYISYTQDLMAIKQRIANIHNRNRQLGRPAHFNHFATWILMVTRARERWTDDAIPMDIQAAANSVTLLNRTPQRMFPNAPDHPDFI
jgi:hypothetical protein